MHTTLTTRRLGMTDMEIATVGFGAWAIGGRNWAFGWGPHDDEQSIATIRYAAEGGINWIDTAAVYGLGHSEEIVRRALEEISAAERPYRRDRGRTHAGAVDGWIDAGSVELTREDLEEITEVLEQTGAGSGPTIPR